jgi:hypothetical protein
LQEKKRLISVTRADLSLGYQAVQSSHALIDFIFEHPSRAGPWHESNYLIQKVVPDLKALKELIRKCERNNLFYTVFREPDIGNQITAIAIEPSPITEKLVSKLPQMFKNKNNEQEDSKHIPENNGNQSQGSKFYQNCPV